nr:hypothetical protein [uncultured Duganella sp.]
MKMHYTLFAAALALSGAAHAAVETVIVPAPTPVAACEQPAIPAMSSSTVGVKRVVRQIAQWRACSADLLARDSSAETQATVDAVEARVATWLNATARYNNGQAQGRLAQTQVERDWREATVTRLGTYAGVRYTAPAPDNANWLEITQ